MPCASCAYIAKANAASREPKMPRPHTTHRPNNLAHSAPAPPKACLNSNHHTPHARPAPPRAHGERTRKSDADAGLLLAAELSTWIKVGKDGAKSREAEREGQRTTWQPADGTSELQRRLERLDAAARSEAARIVDGLHLHSSASAVMRRDATTLDDFMRTAASARELAGMPPSSDVSYMADPLPSESMSAARRAAGQLPPTRIPVQSHVRIHAPLPALGPLGPSHRSHYQPDAAMWETTVFPSLVPAGRQEVILLNKWLDNALASFLDGDVAGSEATAAASRLDPVALTSSSSEPTLSAPSSAPPSAAPAAPLAASAAAFQPLPSATCLIRACTSGAGAAGSVQTGGAPAEAPQLVDTAAGALSIFSVAINEMVRQLSVGCLERGELLASIWEQVSKLAGALIGTLRSTDDRIAAHVRLMHEELLQWAGSNDELRAHVSAVRAERDELAQGMSSAAHERDRMETRALQAEKAIREGETAKRDFVRLDAEHSALLEAFEARRLDLEVARDDCRKLRDALAESREAHNATLSRAEEAEDVVRELKAQLGAIQAAAARSSMRRSRAGLQRQGSSCATTSS